MPLGELYFWLLMLAIIASAVIACAVERITARCRRQREYIHERPSHDARDKQGEFQQYMKNARVS